MYLKNPKLLTEKISPFDLRQYFSKFNSMRTADSACENSMWNPDTESAYGKVRIGLK